MSDEGGSARAFVPGHVTGFFSIHRADDPARTGSRGGGLTLSDGVDVTVSPAGETTVSVDGDPAEVAAVESVLDALDVTARVEVASALPLGAGFGVSGAMALGTALAANHAFDRGRSENDLITLAHVAEVEAGTGLGDVVAQAHGGIPLRLEPGAPPHGRLDGVPDTTRVEYLTLGELSTATVLAGDTRQLSRAGEAALSQVRKRPTLGEFMDASRQFAEGANLLTDDVVEIIEAVEDAGGQASMAMLGRSVYATGTGLTDAGYDARACRTHPAGATLTE